MNQGESSVSRRIDAMMAKDLFSQWLGIERVEERAGYCKLKMTIRPEMCNGFDIAHGGISFSFADSALAFASNSHGPTAVSIETSIAHLKPLKTGDSIVATAEELHCTNRTARYKVDVTRENGELVALFRGTVYIFPEESNPVS